MAQPLHRNINASKVLKAFLILVPIVFLLIYALLPKLPSSPLMRDAFWANKVNKVDQYDIVYIGDSRVYRGIDPAVVESISQLKGFNLGFSSADVDGLLISLAKSKLKPNGPKIILIGVSVNGLLDRPSKHSNEHLKSIIQWSEKDKWIKQHLYPHITMFDQRAVSDLYKYLKGEQYYESYNINNGFAKSNKVPVDSNEALPLYKEEFKIPLSIRKLNDLNHQIQALSQEGYRVILIRMPISLEMYQLEEQKTNQLSLFLDSCRSNSIEVITPRGQFRTYDGSHLQAESAEELSKQIGLHFITNFKF
jgi:hypothetical protein